MTTGKTICHELVVEARICMGIGVLNAGTADESAGHTLQVRETIFAVVVAVGVVVIGSVARTADEYIPAGQSQRGLSVLFLCKKVPSTHHHSIGWREGGYARGRWVASAIAVFFRLGYWERGRWVA